jgi:hypothetical protein
LRVTLASSAPLSLSFGGFIRRSDYERGDRSTCTASSLGFLCVLEFGTRSSGDVPFVVCEGLVMSIWELVWAWCLWPLCQICMLSPPPNKLRVGSALDLDLVSPVGSSSSPLSSSARASASPLAGRGGEAKGSGLAPAFFLVELGEDSEDVSLPWCVTSPARGPVLPAHLVLAMCASCKGVVCSGIR